MMKKLYSVGLVVLLSATLVACGGTKNVQESVPPVQDAMSGSGDGSTSGVSDVSAAQGADLGVEGAGATSGTAGDPLSNRQVYFEYDSSAITEASQQIIEAHAAYLVNNPGITVMLEGNTDERGTREYNLALGERRAKAVAKMMQALGVSSSNIQTVSYGEERPVALGQDETSYSQNRRVEIIYGN